MTAILRSTPILQKSRSLQHSVRTYLVALVLACLLPGLLGASAMFLYQYREGRAQLELNTLHTTRALVQAVDNHLLKVGAVAQALAASNSLKDRNFAEFHKKALEIIAVDALTPSMVLWDSSGSRVLDTSVEFGQPLPPVDLSNHVRQVFESGELQISDVIQNAGDPQPYISITAPVVIEEKISYALSLIVPPRHIVDILLMQSLPSGWIVSVLDTQGTIFARNMDFDRYVGRRATPALSEAMAKSREGIFEGKTQEGIPALNFHSRSALTDWNIAIGIPREILEAGLMQRLLLLALSVALLFAIGVLLAWFMGGRIAASMRMLAQAAIALGRGESVPQVKTDVREADEVGRAIHSASQLLETRASALKTSDAELKEAHQLGKFGTWYWNMKTDEIHNSESVDWIFGRTVPSFHEQRGTLLSEEAWQRLDTARKKAVESGKGYDLELPVNHGDGYTIWISAKSDVVLDDNGKVVALFGTLQDITERKRYEDALRESEASARNAASRAEAERRRLAAVLEATPVGVIVGDSRGRIVHSNAASKRLWGGHHPAPDSVADYKDWKGWWADGSERHGQPLQPHDWPMARALRGEEVVRDIIEIAPFSNSLDRRIVMMSGSVIRDAQGEITGAVIAQMDMTERIKTEEALREAGKRKDEFLAMLAHELRNPLAPISAAADLLQLKQDPAYIAQASAIIARQVKHMASLIDDLLDVSRVTRGLITLDMKPVDINRILAEAVEQVSPMIKGKQHELILRPALVPAMVMGDHKRLVQVLANLLNNAAKYTPDEGHISAAIELEADHVRIEIRDNGMGMPAEVVRHAFELFLQGERKPDRSQGGLGIGLPLVKSLVELHGGEVFAHSDGVGKGSQFVVVLPRYLDADEPPAVESSPVLLKKNSHALKVMVVDDNVDAAQTLAELVSALGHQVIIEHDARTALARSRDEQAHVYLLDIGLPGMDGRQLARCLREQKETAGALIVAVSGYAQDQDGFADAGFDYHFTKPVRASCLAEVLGKVGK